MDTVTVTTSTWQNDGWFLYFENSATLVIENFECETCQAEHPSIGFEQFNLRNSGTLFLTNITGDVTKLKIYSLCV